MSMVERAFPVILLLPPTSLPHCCFQQFPYHTILERCSLRNLDVPLLSESFGLRVNVFFVRLLTFKWPSLRKDERLQARNREQHVIFVQMTSKLRPSLITVHQTGRTAE